MNEPRASLFRIKQREHHATAMEQLQADRRCGTAAPALAMFMHDIVMVIVDSLCQPCTMR